MSFGNLYYSLTPFLITQAEIPDPQNPLQDMYHKKLDLICNKHLNQQMFVILLWSPASQSIS